MNYTTIAQADPWQPYDNNGKKKPKPGVPEVDALGFVLIGFAISLLVARRYLRKQVLGK
jgi:hypothetical protein